MKKIVTIFGLLVLTSILLQSCGMNVVKRQHNKGYHIEFASRNKAHKNDARETALKRSPELAPENETVRQSEAVTAQEATIRNTTSEEQLIASSETQASEVQPVPMSANSAIAPQTVKKTHLNGKFVKTIMDHTPMPKMLKNSVKSVQQGESGARGDGLSLFWIIILVLLILWALGYWGRWLDGGVIHLLLVIALILLILWLLGIV